MEVRLRFFSPEGSIPLWLSGSLLCCNTISWLTTGVQALLGRGGRRAVISYWPIRKVGATNHKLKDNGCNTCLAASASSSQASSTGFKAIMLLWDRVRDSNLGTRKGSWLNRCLPGQSLPFTLAAIFALCQPDYLLLTQTTPKQYSRTFCSSQISLLYVAHSILERLLFIDFTIQKFPLHAP